LNFGPRSCNLILAESMTQKIKRMLFLAAMLSVSTRSMAAADFQSILTAARDIVAGRIFQNEDGILLEFSQIKRLSPGKAEIISLAKFTNGETVTYKETVILDGNQVRLEQTQGDGQPVKFHISVDEPFHVLRIRPMDASESEFLSRECLYEDSEQRHICYMKYKVQSEVFVTIFKELKANG